MRRELITKKKYHTINKLILLITGTACAAILSLATAQDQSPDPYAKADESWISLSGTVTSVAPDSFNLDYGEGLVLVEMDDWDIDADGYKLLEGDEVTVNGRVDDDLFETTSIEASSVYVKGLNTYFYASADDEESLPAAATVSVVDYDLQLTGEVTSVTGREFTVDTGEREMKVDTIQLGYNPLDDEGYQKIDVGDRVSVTGDLDIDWWEKREIMAETVVTLFDRSDSEESGS